MPSRQPRRLPGPGDAGPKDEVTSALDATTAAGIMTLLATLRTEGGVTAVLVTHDHAPISGRADHILDLTGTPGPRHVPDTRHRSTTAGHPT